MDARLDRFDTSKDPRFQKVPKNVRRVHVDKRFQHMFSDKRFVETPAVDSRGRKQKKGSGTQRLREFYALDEDAGGKTGDAGKATRKKSREGGKPKGGEANKEAEAEEPEDDEKAEAEVAECVEATDEEEDESDAEYLGPRGRYLGPEDDDDEDEEESELEDDDEEVEEGMDDIWDQEDQADVPKGDASRRLAVMGCDWDQIKVQDLMVLFASYLISRESRKGGLGATGSVKRVAIYPSDYGLEQMAKEETTGPQFPTLNTKAKNQEEEEANFTEVMRRYQMQRTKYHWALVECDTVATASWLYDQLDGMEAVAICPRSLDIRFVPDDIVPPNAPVSEVTEMPKKYQPPEILKSAVGNAKVTCLWDEVPAQRKRDLRKKKFTATEMADMDLQTYLASSSGEDGEDLEAAATLKRLAKGEDASGSDSDFFNLDKGSDDDGGKKHEMGDMEATFSIKAAEMEDSLADKAKQLQKRAGKRLHSLDAVEEEEKTVWQKYLDKKKEKKKERKQKAKAEREARKSGSLEKDEVEEKPKVKKAPAADAANFDDLALLTAGDDEDERGFNVRGSVRRAHRGQGVDGTAPLSKKKRRAIEAGEKELPETNFEVNLEDPRIANVFNNADFEIDPTNPEFRRTEAMGAVLKKKRQRKVSASTAAAAASALAAPAKAADSAAASREDPGRGGRESSSGGVGGGLQLFAKRSTSSPAAPAAAAPEPAEKSSAGSAAKKRKKAVRA